MTVADENPILRELEKVASSWPGSTYETIVNEYPGNTIKIGTVRFPPCATSTVELEAEAVAGKTAGDGYEIRVKSKLSGEIVWYENWERSMKYFPDGTKISSASAFAEFGSKRVRTLLHTPWVLIVCYGLVLQKKLLLLKAESGWQVDSCVTWFGSRLFVDDAYRVYSHNPSRDV